MCRTFGGKQYIKSTQKSGDIKSSSRNNNLAIEIRWNDEQRIQQSKKTFSYLLNSKINLNEMKIINGEKVNIVADIRIIRRIVSYIFHNLILESQWFERQWCVNYFRLDFERLNFEYPFAMSGTSNELIGSTISTVYVYEVSLVPK